MDEVLKPFQQSLRAGSSLSIDKPASAPPRRLPTLFMRLLGFWFGTICCLLLCVLTLGIYGIYSMIYVNSRGQTSWHPFFGFQAVDYETGKPVPWIFAWLYIPWLQFLIGLALSLTGPLAIVLGPLFTFVNIMTVSLSKRTFRSAALSAAFWPPFHVTHPPACLTLRHHCLPLLDSRLYRGLWIKRAVCSPTKHSASSSCTKRTRLNKKKIGLIVLLLYHWAYW